MSGCGIYTLYRYIQPHPGAAGARDFFSYHERAIYQNLFLPFKVRLGHNMAIMPFKVSLG